MSDTHQAEQSAPEADAHEADSAETVALAREMGWKPESEWRGDPPRGGFTSATEYVRRGEKILPIVNARARKAEERANKLEAEIEAMRGEHRDTIKRIERMSSVALEQQRLNIAAQYGERKEAAVEVGDKAAYRQADKDEREALKAIDERLKEEPAEKKADDKPKELPREIKAVIDEWIGDNSWFNSDEEMHALANTHHMKLIREKPGLTLRQNLDEVREYVKKRFPEKFGDAEDDEDDTPKRRGSPVEGGSRMGGSSGGGLYSKLPADARAQCDKFIKEDGLFLEKGETAAKNLSAARERYAKQYMEMEQ